MVTAKAFIEQVLIPLQQGWGYIYGTWGTLWTKEKQAASTREMTVKYGSRWIGDMVTDCSGLLRWALHQLGEDIVHHARYQYTDYCDKKGRLVHGRMEDGMPILPGTAVFLKGSKPHIHHVGVYIGDNVCEEAKGTVYGVVTSKLDHWDYWGELKMVDYTDAAALEGGDPGRFVPQDPEEAEAGTIIKAVVNNPQTWLNVRSAPSSEAQIVMKIRKGSVVDALDAGEPEWWKIRYDGKTGWAFAKYLDPIGEEGEGPWPSEGETQPEPPEQDVGNNPETDGPDIILSEMADCIQDIYKNIEELTELVRQLKEAIR